MIICKITVGYVAQRWDTEKKEWVGQEFIASADVTYEDIVGEAVDSDLLEDKDGCEPYLPFDMKQPDEKAKKAARKAAGKIKPKKRK